MTKNIKELTEEEAREILEFVYPDNKSKWFKKLSFEPKIKEDGSQQVTFGLRPIIGIEYNNGQDNCVLHFDNTKVVLWLYRNGYEIGDLLEENAYYSEMENDFEDFGLAIEMLSEGEKQFSEGFKHNWTLDYVKKKCREYLDRYFYKGYKREYEE